MTSCKRFAYVLDHAHGFSLAAIIGLGRDFPLQSLCRTYGLIYGLGDCREAAYLLAGVIVVNASIGLLAQAPAGPDAPATSDGPAPQVQTPAATAQPPATGSVSGHVYLGDSHLPARMAYVMLLPGGADAGDKKPVVSSGTVQAGLDGAYVIPNVLPGTYYVIAAKLGYASPLAGTDPDDFDRASEGEKRSMTADADACRGHRQPRVDEPTSC